MDGKQLRLTLCLALAIAGALVFASEPTRADGDCFDFSGNAWPQEFTERLESKLYRFDNWTFQRVDHYKYAYDRPESSLNVFYGDMPAKRIAIGSDSGGAIEVSAAKKLYPTSDRYRANTKTMPLFDMTGDGTPCLVLSFSGFPHTREGYLEVWRLDADAKAPVNSTVTKLYSHSNCYAGHDLVDLDGDRVPEIIDPIGTGIDHNSATVYALMGRVALVLKWDAKAEGYVAADPTLLHSPVVSDSRRKKSTKEERVKLVEKWAKEYCANVVEKQKPGSKKAYSRDYNAYEMINDFAELVFVGEGKRFIDLYETYCPGSVLWPSYGDKRITKKEFWDWLVTNTKAERERFKQWLPNIMKLKTSKETKTDTPWKALK